MGALPRIKAAAIALVALGLMVGCTSTGQPAASRTAKAASSAAIPQSDEIAAELVQLARDSGITDPPKVDVVSVVSAADWPSTMLSCLHDAGYASAQLSPDGSGVSVNVPDGQETAYNLAMYTCEAKYPRDPVQDVSQMTREQKLIAYDYLTKTLVECLRGQGYTINDIPSQETFLDSWDTAPWNPYTQVRAPSDDLVRACPENTPSRLIWGN